MSKLPSYRHARNGYARVTINGRDYSLGKFGTKASRQRYDAIIGEYLASCRSNTFGTDRNDVLISELMVAYLKHCKAWYPDGPNSETPRVKSILAELKRRYSRLLKYPKFSHRHSSRSNPRLAPGIWTRHNQLSNRLRCDLPESDNTMIAQLTLLSLLFLQTGKPADTRQDDKKPLPILKTKLVEIDKLFKAALKESSSKKTTADKQDAVEKHFELIEEWCAKQDGETWDFEVVIKDIEKGDGSYFALTGPSSLLKPFTQSDRPLLANSRLKFELTEEQKETFTIGTKLRVIATVQSTKTSRQGNVGLNQSINLDDGSYGRTDSQGNTLFELHVDARKLSDNAQGLRIQEKKFVFRLDDVELEVIGEIKPEKQNKKRK